MAESPDDGDDVEAQVVAAGWARLAEPADGQAMDPANTVGYRDDRALRTGFGAHVQILNLALDQLADLGRIQLHEVLLVLKRRGHRIKLAAYGSVDHFIADDDGDASYQFVIHSHVGLNLALVFRFEIADQAC